jgi:hypothetical protein
VGRSLKRQPGTTQIHSVATHRDALFKQERALLPSLRKAPVGADDAMPREAIVDGRKNVTDEARRGGVDVTIGADEPSWDRAYPGDDTIGARRNAGRPLTSAARIRPATSSARR